MSDIDTYRRRLTALTERAGPDQVTQARILAGELRAAHKDALYERDRAAASLHQHHGWSITRLCMVIHGRPTKQAEVREAIDAVKPHRRVSAARAEQTFRDAQRRVEELWFLYRQAKACEKHAAAEVDAAEPQVTLDLPEAPLARAEAAADQLREVEDQLAEAVEARNRGAAALVVHAGWTKRQAAGLAGMAVRDLYPHEKTASADEADPYKVDGLAKRVRELQARRKALVAARDEAVRQITDLGPVEIAKRIGRTDRLVVRALRAA